MAGEMNHFDEADNLVDVSKKKAEKAKIFNMIDGYGRNIDYIRISLTDRCNLRCVYCMPEEGIEPVCHSDILTYDEILCLAELFASLGFKKIKLTGGEPLVRKDAAKLAGQMKQIPGIEQVTLTTNGILLADAMEDLAQAGIDGINLSLDTLSPKIFQQITRRDQFEKTMEGFQAALNYPQIPLKINCVPMGIEGQNILELAELARKYPVHVRYIEMMPIGLGSQFEFCSEDSILEGLRKKYGEYKVYEKQLGNGPGHYYQFEGFKGKIGFISAISHKFCESCNRVRLTSQGYLKTCLQYDVGTDLRKLLREGAEDEVIRQAVMDAVQRKPVSHQFVEGAGEHREEKIMSQIGG